MKSEVILASKSDREILLQVKETAKALAEIKDFGTAKDMRDRVQALQDYIKTKYGPTSEHAIAVSILKARMERHVGSMLTESVQQGGHNKKQSTTTVLCSGGLPEGVTRNQSSRWQKIAKLSEAKFESAVETAQEKKELLTTQSLLRLCKDVEREGKRTRNAEMVAEMPVEAKSLDEIDDATFSAIAIDPPWDWGDEGDVSQMGRGDPTYATMPFDELLALPVGDKAAKDAHLYLWITNRSLPKGFELLDAWGFRYVTCLTWCKPSIGMGNYFRGSTEQILFGVKGSLPLLRNDVGTWFQAERQGRHSTKPEEFYELVESCSPGPWLEMFARKERQGWTTWGAEVS